MKGQVIPREEPGSRLAHTLLSALGFTLLTLIVQGLWQAPAAFPDSWTLGLHGPINDFQGWVIRNQTTHPLFTWFFHPLSDGVDWGLRGVEALLLEIPWFVLVTTFFLVARKVSHPRLALWGTVSLVYLGAVELWDASMQTLALMGVSVLLSLLVAIPLGIWSALNERVERVLRPLLDAMQTMPAFVYLIPVLLFFGIARVPSVIATVIYALPPAIRLTSLGIRQVPKATVEAAQSFGSTPRQLLFKVQLPLALPTIMAGVNQSTMMALSMVVIAALIGAGGLGREVLIALQRLQVGKGMEAGLAIVALAITLDRLFEALSHPREPSVEQEQSFMPRYRYWLGSAALLLLLLVVSYVGDLGEFPAAIRLNLRDGVDLAVRWMRDNLYQIGDLPLGSGPLSDALTLYALNPLRHLFQSWLSWPLVIALFALLSFRLAGWRTALFAGVGLFGIGLLGMWELSMDTLSQTLVAVLLTVVLGIPLGILAARHPLVETLLRPLLDAFQTIPSFVFLVPVIMLFNVGRVPGIIASVIYALPPLIRLTTLGIRQVPKETVEAAIAFGSTPGQLLWKVQWPLALPTIMMGVNQAVMMVFAMVIIAGIVGGGGLGLEVVKGLTRNDLGRGFEAGLAIVLLAMILDRATQGWA
ncbi:MAG: ABC transporter permease subunit, partial [Ardenticatenales bacterium]|nr:ABC transporter permease subunit [Ardenticatenales bacterium]